MAYQKPKGTRDIYGAELKRIETIGSAAREYFMLHGYKEIRTPTFEFADLFIRSIGEHTDIVEKENYTFKIDDKLFMLRPEGTASVLRAMIENSINPPVRFLYIEPMYRKEKPQKGRFREFLQIGIELIGEGDSFYDAEMIAQGRGFLSRVGLKDFMIEINSIGCPECRGVYKEKLKKELKPVIEKLCENCRHRIDKNFLRIFDCKHESCQQVYAQMPYITDNLCSGCQTHYNQVKEYLKIYAVEYKENKRLVRGLDYYTRTVFEIKHHGLGTQDTVLAGGRYDLLMKELGGADTPALGWAMGVDRLLMAISEQDTGIVQPKKICLMTNDKKYLGQLIELQNTLQKQGLICCIIDPVNTFKVQFKKANRLESDYVIIYGEDEASQKTYSVKDMKSGEQEAVSISDILDYIKKQ